MNDNFNKNDFKQNNEKLKIIIDCDPGVDDSACLIYALFDENVDLKLITTVVGNVNVHLTTRNVLHLLDLLGASVPVAKGAEKALKRVSPTAEFIHQADGLGGYIPPKTTKNKPVQLDAVEAMYQTIMSGDGDIVPILLGPQTNMATLLTSHPDVKDKIPKIIFMGGAPHGNPDYPEHISFNLSSDPDAFKIVLGSGIPLVMIPSIMGREWAHLTEDFVLSLGEINDVGKFLALSYSKYYEPKYFPEKRITTNDTCTFFAHVYPKLFTFKKAFVSVDTEEFFGRTTVDFNQNGNVMFACGIDREKFLNLLTHELKKLNHIKIPLNKE